MVQTKDVNSLPAKNHEIRDVASSYGQIRIKMSRHETTLGLLGVDIREAEVVNSQIGVEPELVGTLEGVQKGNVDSAGKKVCG